MQKQMLDLINLLDDFDVQESINVERYNCGKLITKHELLDKLEALDEMISTLPLKLGKLKEEIRSSLEHDYEMLKTFHNTDHRIIVGKNHNLKYDKVQVSDDEYIDAIVVDSFDDVQQDGHIYYVEPNNHFAFYLNGRLYHGNIGQCSDSRKLKTCINEGCRTNEHTRTQCTFYHNPLIIPESSEVRNYYGKYYTTFRTKNDPEFLASKSDKIVHDVLVLHTRSYECFLT